MRLFCEYLNSTYFEDVGLQISDASGNSLRDVHGESSSQTAHQGGALPRGTGNIFALYPNQASSLRQCL